MTLAASFPVKGIIYFVLVVVEYVIWKSVDCLYLADGQANCALRYFYWMTRRGTERGGFHGRGNHIRSATAPFPSARASVFPPFLGVDSRNAV